MPRLVGGRLSADVGGRVSEEPDQACTSDASSLDVDEMWTRCVRLLGHTRERLNYALPAD